MKTIIPAFVLLTITSASVFAGNGGYNGGNYCTPAVPDGGSTLAMAGIAVTGLALFVRRRLRK